MFLKGENLDFGYSSEKLVLRRISFALNKGDTLSIVGASGCGKSTLLRIISSILPATKDNRLSGQIRIDGKNPDEYRRTGKLAFMFQDATLMPNLTVKENIAFPLKIRAIRNDERVSDLLQIVGLEEYANYLPKQLSGGMKTRVALARSFVTGPELLLLDEPFSALDIAWKSNLYVELEKLREQYHTTVVFVTHDVQEALLLSNHVIVMSRTGEIKGSYQIRSGKSLIERVHDISSFMNEVYSDYLIPIQELIMLDGRKTTNRRESLRVAEKISTADEGEAEDEKVSSVRIA